MKQNFLYCTKLLANESSFEVLSVYFIDLKELLLHKLVTAFHTFLRRKFMASEKRIIDYNHTKNVKRSTVFFKNSLIFQNAIFSIKQNFVVVCILVHHMIMLWTRFSRPSRILAVIYSYNVQIHIYIIWTRTWSQIRPTIFTIMRRLSSLRDN